MILVKIFPRKELAILPADTPEKENIGWKVQEHIGVAYFNTKALKRIVECPSCGGLLCREDPCCDYGTVYRVIET